MSGLRERDRLRVAMYNRQRAHSQTEPSTDTVQEEVLGNNSSGLWYRAHWHNGSSETSVPTYETTRRQFQETMPFLLTAVNWNIVQ